MGSVVKRIRRNVNKFQKAFDIIEKNFGDVQNSMPASFERYDLVAAVKEEVDKKLEENKKTRNKRKAIRRARRLSG